MFIGVNNWHRLDARTPHVLVAMSIIRIYGCVGYQLIYVSTFLGQFSHKSSAYKNPNYHYDLSNNAIITYPNFMKCLLINMTKNSSQN